MRHALPILWCIDEKVRLKLARMLENLGSIPPNQWTEWQTPEAQQAIHDYEKYKAIHKFMRQKPHSPAKVK